jgi:hypothetical protein
MSSDTFVSIFRLVRPRRDDDEEEDEEEEEAGEKEEAEEVEGKGVGGNWSSSNNFHASISTISINGGAPAKSKSGRLCRAVSENGICRAVSENGKVENNVMSVMPLSGTNPASDN